MRAIALIAAAIATGAGAMLAAAPAVAVEEPVAPDEQQIIDGALLVSVDGGAFSPAPAVPLTLRIGEDGAATAAIVPGDTLSASATIRNAGPAEGELLVTVADVKRTATTSDAFLDQLLIGGEPASSLEPGAILHRAMLAQGEEMTFDLEATLAGDQPLSGDQQSSVVVELDMLLYGVPPAEDEEHDPAGQWGVLGADGDPYAGLSLTAIPGAAQAPGSITTAAAAALAIAGIAGSSIPLRRTGGIA